MKEVINSIISTRTFKDTSISFFGTAINGLLGVFYYILMARLLGPADYGTFSIAIASIALIASIANVGIDTGIVRFVGESAHGKDDKALKFLKLGLKIKILSSLVVIVLGWFLVPFFSNFIFLKPELTYPFRLSLLGVASALLFSFSTSALQALEKFWLWSFVNIFANSLRLVLAVVFLTLGFLNVSGSLYSYILASLIGFFVGTFFLPPFYKTKGEGKLSKVFLNFNFQVAIFSLISAVSSRLDTFLAARFLSLSQVGIYSVAVSLTSIIPQVVFAIGSVVAPKLARFTNNTDAIDYLKKLQLLVLAISFVGLPIGFILGKILISLVYGPQYFGSYAPLVILLISQVIFLISTPIHTATIYYFSKPGVFIWTSLGHLLLVLILGLLLITNYGYIGLALTMLVGNIFNLIIPGLWLINKFKKE